MADQVGETVIADEIGKSLKTAGPGMFPGYDHDHISDFVKVPDDGKCLRSRTIQFLVDFATIATDLGTAKELLGLAGSLLQVNPTSLSPSTVITVAGKVINTLDDLASKREGKGSQKFTVPVHLCCHKLAQPFKVEMTLAGLLQVQDKSPNDFVDLDVTLIGPDRARDHRHLRRNGSELQGGRTLNFIDTPELKDPLSIAFVTDSDFDLVVIFNEETHVDYDPFNPSIAGIRVQDISLTITTDSQCKEGKTPPLTMPPVPKESKTTTEQSSGTALPKPEGEVPSSGGAKSQMPVEDLPKKKKKEKEAGQH